MKIFKSMRGQAMVLYAILTPLMFAAAGVAADLGWYYINAARLQNAADAAVIAGAQKLIKNLHNANDSGGTSDYNYYNFVDKVPVGFNSVDRDTSTGDSAAKDYISQNYLNNYNWSKNNSITDSWTDSEVFFKKNFYAPQVSDEDDDKKYYAYYEVVLTEKPEHLFEIFNSFGEINLQAKAVAKLSRIYEREAGPNLIEQMEQLKDQVVYRQFYEIMYEYQIFRAKTKEQLANKIQSLIDGGMDAAEAKNLVEQEWKTDFASKYILTGRSKSDAEKMAEEILSDKVFTKNSEDPAFKQAQDRNIQTNGNYWLANLSTHRTEGSTMRGLGGQTWKVDQYNIDDLFIDFKTDLNYAFKEDWDLTEPTFKGLQYVTGNCKIFDSKQDPKNQRFNYRIHSLINIEGERDGKVIPKGKFPYRRREGKTGYDPLYARIESEQIKVYEINGNEKNFKTFNSVHQIMINVNVSNTADNERPMIFFYDGPQTFEENSAVRKSKPVILNLNANFKGVLYAPNSPVIVTGNGYSFEGFIVAKEFLKLKTAEEFIPEGYKTVVRCPMNLVEDADNSPITEYNAYFESNKIYAENNLFVKEEDIIDAENLPTNIPAEIVGNYIAVNYLGKVCYIERKTKYFEELTTMRVDGAKAYSSIKVSKIIIESTHGDVVTSGEIEPTFTNSEKAAYNDEPDVIFQLNDFNLSSSKYNSFLLLKFSNYKYLNRPNGVDNMFLYNRGLNVD